MRGTYNFGMRKRDSLSSTSHTRDQKTQKRRATHEESKTILRKLAKKPSISNHNAQTIELFSALFLIAFVMFSFVQFGLHLELFDSGIFAPSITGQAVTITDPPESGNYTTGVDLAVLNISFNDSSITDGESVNISFTFMNNGTENITDGYIARVYSDFPVSSSVEVLSGTLESGALVNVTLGPFTYSVGDFTIVGEVDSLDNVAEVNENNNNITFNFSTGQTPHTLSLISIVPGTDQTVTKGTLSNLTLNVSCNGGSCGTINLTLHDNSNDLLIHAPNDLEYNATNISNLSYTNASNGFSVVGENPIACTHVGAGEHCSATFVLNATAGAGSMQTFYLMYNSSQDFGITSTLDYTVGSEDISAPNISVVDPDCDNDLTNCTFESIVTYQTNITTDENATCEVNVEIDSGITNASVADFTFGSGNAMSTIDNRTHSYSITNLTEYTSYHLLYKCSDNESNVNSAPASGTFFMNTTDHTAPVITDFDPANTTQLPSGTTLVAINLTTNESSVCYSAQSSGISIGNSTLMTNSSPTVHHVNRSTSDGVHYSEYIRCEDTFGNRMNETRLQYEVLGIDNDDPEIEELYIELEDITSRIQMVVLVVETDEPATCRFKTDDEEFEVDDASEFDELWNFETTGGRTEHKTYEFYDSFHEDITLSVKCSDDSNNTMNSFDEVNFKVDPDNDATRMRGEYESDLGLSLNRLRDMINFLEDEIDIYEDELDDFPSTGREDELEILIEDLDKKRDLFEDYDDDLDEDHEDSENDEDKNLDDGDLNKLINEILDEDYDGDNEDGRYPLEIVAQEDEEFDEIEPDEIVDLDVSRSDIAVSEVEFSIDNTESDLTLTVARISRMPFEIEPLPRAAYQYFIIDHENELSNVNNGTITFTVDSSDISTYDIDEDRVKLYRLVDGSWIGLPTEEDGSDSDGTRFVAETPGFSFFAIGYKGDCQTEWLCQEEYGACIDSVQKKVCKDIYYCSNQTAEVDGDTYLYSKLETQSCTGGTTTPSSTPPTDLEPPAPITPPVSSPSPLPLPLCNDGILNGEETDIDCGGTCGACASCFDGIRNQDEERVDCGGVCTACPGTTSAPGEDTPSSNEGTTREPETQEPTVLYDDDSGTSIWMWLLYGLLFVATIGGGYFAYQQYFLKQNPYDPELITYVSQNITNLIPGQQIKAVCVEQQWDEDIVEGIIRVAEYILQNLEQGETKNVIINHLFEQGWDMHSLHFIVDQMILYYILNEVTRHGMTNPEQIENYFLNEGFERSDIDKAIEKIGGVPRT